MFSVVLFSMFVSILAVPQPQEISISSFRKAEATCLELFPTVSKDLLEELKRTKTFPKNPTDDFKCFMDCWGRQVGVIDSEGNYHFEKLKDVVSKAAESSSLTEQEIHEAVEECIKIEHTHACEKAHLYASCKFDRLSHGKVHKDLCETCE